MTAVTDAATATDVFISYARADRATAEALARLLEARGLKVWWDFNLQAGTVFSEEIRRQLNVARHVIVLWSSSSISSHFVQDEAEYARRLDKLLPFRLDDCQIPIGFGRIHTVDVRDDDFSHILDRLLPRAASAKAGQAITQQPIAPPQAPKLGTLAAVPADRIDAARAISASETGAAPLLTLDGVTKAYGALVAVDNVSMQVADGEVRAVIGPNGAGKTTLFHVVTGVVKPTRGTIRFAGEDITGLPAHAVCQKGLSRTFQLTSLFPEMSARENAMLAAQARDPGRWRPFGGTQTFADARRKGDAAIEQLGLAHVADRPAGLLSHGDQRLLEVAMAIAQQPKVLLLDEPTQGLSVEETAQAVETLAQFLAASRITVLLVEHDMEVVFRLAHRITVLHRGGVIADGPPAEVKANARVQEAYLGGME